MAAAEFETITRDQYHFVWAKELEEEMVDGGFRYYATYAVALRRTTPNEAGQRLGRVWAHPWKQLLWDGERVHGADEVRFYDGARSQEPDSIIKEHVGDSVPAFAGWSLLVIKRLRVDVDGVVPPYGAFPQLFAEVAGIERAGGANPVKYAVSELEGALLDAAVAKAEGYPYEIDGFDVCNARRHPPSATPWPVATSDLSAFAPSVWWQDGGPIIYRERINVVEIRKGEWWAEPTAESFRSLEGVLVGASSKGEGGPTPLIAAMRAYVASRFGETVELP